MRQMEYAGDNPLPLWMQRMKQSEELARAKAEAANQRALADAMMVKADGPAFWTRFVKELQRQAGLFDSIGIRGSAVPIGSVDSEAQCRIEVSPSESLQPKLAYIIFFYRKGHTVIRSFCTEKNQPEFQFQIYPEGLMVIADSSSSPMNPEEAADFALEWIVAKVKQ
jgi:hypothetical protein